MNTPVWNFVRKYRKSNTVRMHMPGHKGRGPLGIEPYDITEIAGADELFAPDGIIAQSEANATQCFQTGATFYSTEGSSLSIRAMLSLVLQQKTPQQSAVIVAPRNVHKAFLYAAALLDITVEWIYPKTQSSICSCPLSAEMLEEKLKQMPQIPAAVYVTSPDYLGQRQPIEQLAKVAHQFGTLLIVDNAHGAYLHFLKKPLHPMDLGADMCCDSAHKTLPVLTGGAYLHLAKHLPDVYKESAKAALSLFASTSPSYLILSSLDACNLYLKEQITKEQEQFIVLVDKTKQKLQKNGWNILETDPFRITISQPNKAQEVCKLLRDGGIEMEYADDDYVVLMLTPFNDKMDLIQLVGALKTNPFQNMETSDTVISVPQETCCSIRQAILAPCEKVEVDKSIGRISADPAVSCPPAIPIVMPGERIEKKQVELFEKYHISMVTVMKE